MQLGRKESPEGLCFLCMQSGNAQKSRFDLGRPAWTVGHGEEVSVNMQGGRMAPSSQPTSGVSGGSQSNGRMGTCPKNKTIMAVGVGVEGKGGVW